MQTTSYSIVVPLKNEEENIQDLVQEIVPVMETLQKKWELICVDDGSTDKTLEILQQLQTRYPEIRILSFEKNFGQSSAFDAGFKAALGEFIITLDGDRQNDPKDIPALLQYTEKHDLVCGYRANRKDPIHKKVQSKIANFIRSRVCADGVRDTGCSLKVYRRSALQSIKLFNGMHRFLPALFLIEGYTVTEVPVNHRERVKGTTKYNFLNRSFNTIADMLAVSWMKSRHLHYKLKKDS